VIPFTEVHVTFLHGKTTLAGTLFLPIQEGPHPAMVLLHGSDRSDRRSFRDLASHFATQGIAALCYDSPGSGRSTGKRQQQSLDQRTEEACAAVGLLHTRREVRKHQIGVWGFSQGASVALMTAARLPEVAFVIAVSGSGVSGLEQMLHFARASGQANHLPPEDIAKLVTFVELFFAQMRDSDTLDFAQIEKRVRPWGDPSWLEFLRVVKDRRTLPANERLGAVQKCLRSWKEAPWWKPTFGGSAGFLLEMKAEDYDPFLVANRQGVDFDPRPYLKKVRCPALVLFGGKDVVGPVEKSAAIYRQGLEEAGNPDVTLRIFPRGNHAIQFGPQGRFEPTYLETMVDWIHAHTRETAGARAILLFRDQRRIVLASPVPQRCKEGEGWREGTTIPRCYI
jgi:pimeloyl-ACP methyl ester carboxylesterase